MIVDPKQCMDNMVNSILRADGYVDARKIAAAMPTQPPHRLEVFQSISAYNRQVDAAIEIYWYSQSIRYYSEMERFVISCVWKWDKKVGTAPARFEEIGIGKLCRNDKVKKLFSFDDNVKVEDILEFEREKILLHLMSRRFGKIRFDTLQAEDMKHFREEALRQRKVLGVFFDVSLYHINLQKPPEKTGELVKKLRQRQAEEMARNELISSSNHHQHQHPCAIRAVDIDSFLGDVDQSALSKIKIEIFKSHDFSDTFNAVFFLFRDFRGKCGNIVQDVNIEEIFEWVSVKNRDHKVLCDEGTAKTLLICANLLVQEFLLENNVDRHAGLNEHMVGIFTWLEVAFPVIPPPFYECMRSLLVDIMTLLDHSTLESTEIATGTRTNSFFNKCCTDIAPQFVSFHDDGEMFSMHIYHELDGIRLVGAITSTIVFLRQYSLRKLATCSAIGPSKFDVILDNIIESCPRVEFHPNNFDEILKILVEIEYQLKIKLGAIALEGLGCGSFLSCLQKSGTREKMRAAFPRPAEMSSTGTEEAGDRISATQLTQLLTDLICCELDQVDEAIHPLKLLQRIYYKVNEIGSCPDGDWLMSLQHLYDEDDEVRLRLDRMLRISTSVESFETSVLEIVS